MQPFENFRRDRRDHPSRVFHMLLLLGIGVLSSLPTREAEAPSVLGSSGSGSLGVLRSRLPFKRLVP